MAKNLVIVESPAKASTIEKFLGKDFKVKASYGHVRDLPKTKLGVDLENNFEPQYLIPKKAKPVIKELKEDVKKIDSLYLATDLDREGEAIAWHLVQALGLKNSNDQDPMTNQTQSSKTKKVKKKKNKIKVHRIVFNQITENAVKDAVENPREIDVNLVDAQQARRVLDRLVGYKLSPFLWSKVRKGLSAGRVQSVAVRLIVEREREIEKFKSDEYWELIANLRKQEIDKSISREYSGQGNQEERGNFEAKLLKKDNEELKIGSKKEADEVLSDLDGAKYIVGEVRKKEKMRHPAPPFTTSTLQQEAARKLGFSAKRTMVIAQQLYEGINLGEKDRKGLITYMRTDSVNLASEALDNIRKIIVDRYSKDYLPEKPNFYKSKKGAQEAHEAIRPTHPDLAPEDVEEFLDASQFKLYSLIWKRALASQMNSAVMDTTSVDVVAGAKSEKLKVKSNGTASSSAKAPEDKSADKSPQYLFRATGSVIKFDGFIKVYMEGKDEGDNDDDREGLLPELEKDEKLDLQELISEQKFTQPPPRFTEASLVKELEKNEIGRPSTYAPTLSTIQDRGYVELEDKKFKPLEIGIIVNDVLVEHFPKIVDVGFTAEMENKLDSIEEGDKDWHKIIGDFWGPFIENLEKKEKEIKKEDVIDEKITDIKCPQCGKPLQEKYGRFGKFLACTGFPECKHTQPLNETKEEKEAIEKENHGKCEKCGKEMVIKEGRFGKFLACSGYPECKNIKSINKTIGMKCPECEKGDVVVRFTKKKRRFWGCSEYPKCKYASWTDPSSPKASKDKPDTKSQKDEEEKNEKNEKG